VDAVAVPLELAGACWLLSARLERRALAEEYALVELLLGFGGDLVHAFPLRAHTARERVDAGTPLLQLTAEDLLRMARETPCRATRVATAWVVLVLAVTPVAKWMWHATLYEGVGSVVTGALIAACLLPFAVAWKDLRQGRVRSLRDPRRARLWGEGYQPARPPLVLPSVPMMLIMLLPAGLLGASWATGTTPLAGRQKIHTFGRGAATAHRVHDLATHSVVIGASNSAERLSLTGPRVRCHPTTRESRDPA
jgi:hypothetical protein